MELPQDIGILLSFVNMKLRDFYPSLDEMCHALDIDREALESKLNQAGFQYDSTLNKFW